MGRGKAQANLLEKNYDLLGEVIHSERERMAKSSKYVRQNYFKAELDGTRRTTKAKFKGLNKSIKVAYNGMETRLEGMNEFRETLRDQAASFLTRSEYATDHLRLEEDIKFLRENRALLEGKASQFSVMVAYILSAISIVVAVGSVGIELVRLIGGK